MTTQTMQAVYIENFGGMEQLKTGQLPLPQVNPNEVKIKIAYTAVNPVDGKIREGVLKDHLPHHFPIILGWDAAGVIDEVGSNVSQFKKGDKVYAYCRKPTVQWGSYAEYICLEAQNVAFMPSNLTFAQAAAIPLAALTAWQVLFDKAHLKKDETILIQAGAGGVGSLAIQFAKLADARVITTGSEANRAYLMSLGADIMIDYHSKNIWHEIKKIAPNGIDVVFDTLGGQSLNDGYSILKKQGKIISIVEPPSEDLNKRHDVQGFYHFVSPNGKELQNISNLIQEGKIKPVPIQEMSLEQASEAQEINHKGHVRGKIVLKVSHH